MDFKGRPVEVPNVNLTNYNLRLIKTERNSENDGDDADSRNADMANIQPWTERLRTQDTKRERDIFTALLNQVGDSTDYADRLIEQGIRYCDLSSLTDEDLKLIGFDAQTRFDLLQTFSQLPNQDLCYEQILQLQDAKMFSNEIIKSCSEHVAFLKLALNSANYEMMAKPRIDDVLDERYFASRYALQTLSKIHNTAAEMKTKWLTFCQKTKTDKNLIIKPNPSNVKRGLFNFSVVLAIAFGTFSTFLAFKYNLLNM